MGELKGAEIRALLSGTWGVLAMLIEILIDDDLVSREELLLILSRAERSAMDQRATVFSGLRLLIESGFR